MREHARLPTLRVMHVPDTSALLAELRSLPEAAAVTRVSTLGANADGRAVPALLAAALDASSTPRIVSAAWDAIAAIAARRGAAPLAASESSARAHDSDARTDVDVVVPVIGAVTTAVVVALLVRVGDHVERGAVLLELDTDKASIEITAETSARVNAVNVALGDTVAIGAVLLRLTPSG